jgi:ABC-type sugar transport system permease subunit
MVSPVILFSAILVLIQSLQQFTLAYIMTSGGPNRATYFYNLYLYETAFRSLQMGLASAQAWILFMLTMVCTALFFWVSRGRVFYLGR